MKKEPFISHVIFWMGIYLLWVIAFRSYSVSLSKTMTIEFCYLVFITADYYLISNLIVPQFLITRKYALFIAATIFLIAISSWLRALVAMMMNLHFFHPASMPEFAVLYVNSIINISLWVLVIMVGKMIIERRQSHQQLELIEKEKTKNELDYLKAQINPHALFNSLNTIYGHIDKSNQTARNILLQFSELLRYQLYDCSAEKLSLEKEIEYIKSYVAFQQLRKNDNLVVSLEIENEGTGLEIAPLLLIVLIENAFKFVSDSPVKDNNIAVKLSVKASELNCSVYNTTEIQSPVSNSKSKGIGISNLKRRLELMYPGKYAFTNELKENIYVANLTIDLS